MHNKEFFVASHDVDSFLIAFQGMKDAWRESILFIRDLGPEEIELFKRTLKVPEKWIKILESMEGGLKILERFASKRYKRKKIELVSKRDKTFVPKVMAAQVLDNIQKIGKLTTDRELAKAIGKKHSSFISLIRSEKALLRLEHLELVAEKFGVTVDDLLTLTTEADIRDENKIFGNEYDETIYIEEINMVMQKACLFTGSLAETSLELDKRRFFLGYLLEKLPGYELCFSSKNGEVSFRNGKFTYTWNIQHLEFD